MRGFLLSAAGVATPGQRQTANGPTPSATGGLLRSQSSLPERLGALVCTGFLLVAGAVPMSVDAATNYWDGANTGDANNISTGAGLGGAGTWDGSTANWWTNGAAADFPWISGDTAYFWGTAGTVSLNSSVTAGGLIFNTTGYILSGTGVLTLNGAAFIQVNSGLSATIGNNTALTLAGSAGLTKTGAGTLTLNGSAVNTFTGGLAVNGGTLTLDFSNLSTPTDLINNANRLTFGNSGTLSIVGKSGATTAQTFNGLTLNAGGAVISTTQNGATALNVTLGGITRSAGSTVNFILPTTGYINTSQGNVNGILGPWAAVGTGAATAYAVGAGNISALNPADVGPASVVDTTGTMNYDVNAAGTLGTGANFNTLRYTGAAGTVAGDFAANGLMNSSGNLLTMSGNITIGSTKELVVNTANGNITLSGTIANNAGGASALVLSGTGTLILSGVNTFTGGITINAGTVKDGPALAMGNNPITIGASAVLDLTGTTGDNYIREFSGSGQIKANYQSDVIVNSLNDTTFSGTDFVSGNPWGLAKTGPGTLTFTDDTIQLNSRTGTVSANFWRGGVTFGGASGALSYADTNPHINLYGGTLTIDESSADIDRVNNAMNVSLNGGNSTFRYIGNGSADSAETVGALSAAVAGPTLTIDVQPGSGRNAALTFASYGVTGGSDTTGGPGLVNFKTGAGNTFGSDAKVLFTTTPTLQNGVLQGGIVNGTDFATYESTTPKGIMAFGSTGSGTSYKNPTDVNDATIASTDTVLINGTTTTLALTADKRYNALKIDGPRTLDLGGNTLSVGQSQASYLGAMILKTGEGQAEITSTATGGLDNQVNRSSTPYYRADNYHFYVNEGVLKVTARVLGGTSSSYVRVNKAGPGLLWLDPVATWPTTRSDQGSGIYFSEGAIRLNPDLGGTGTAGRFGNLPMVLNGGVMELDNMSAAYNPTIGTGNANLRWQSSGGFAAYGTDATFSRDITWNAANHIPDGAALLLNSTTANKKITLSGTLNIGNDANKMYLREINVADNTNSVTDLAEISGQIISDNAGSPTYSYHLVKTGAGTLSLANANNNYSGATYVKEGTLLVNGTLLAAASSAVANNSNYYAVTVMNGAKLGGTGTVNRAVILESGATIAPGGSPGLFTVNGDLTLAAGSAYQWEMQGGSVAGTGWDLLVVNGSILLPSSGTVYLDITQYASGFSWSSNSLAKQYLIAEGTFSSTDTNKFVLRMDSFFTPFTNLFTLSFTDGTKLYLNYAGLAVPVSVWGGSNGNWDTDANWVGGAKPVAGHEKVLQFNNDGNLAYVSTNDLGAFNLNRLIVSNMNAAVPVLVGTGGSSLVFTGATPILEQAGSGGFIISNDVQLAAGLSAQGSGSGMLTIAGAISGSNGLAKAGNWTLLLNGTNSFVGTVNVNGGVLAVNASNALGNAANVIQVSGGALSGVVDWADARTISLNGGTLSGATFTNLGTVTGAGTITANIVNQNLLALGNSLISGAVSNQGLLVASNGTLTVTGILGGNGTNRAVSGGTLALYGVNSFTRSVDIAGGTLLVTNDNALGAAGLAVVFDTAGGTLAISNTTTFASSRNLTLNANGIVSVATNSVAAWNGTIAGSGDLAKTGAGWLLLTNSTPYNYSGATFVSGGVFAVNGTLSSADGAVRAQGGGTLGGTGTVLRAVVIGNSGTVSPGTVGSTLAAQLGTLVASNMTWESGGSYLWQAYDLNQSGTPGASTTWDLIRLSGELTVSASQSSPFTFTMQSLTNDGSLGGPINWPSGIGHNEWLVLTADKITGFQQNINVSVDSSQWWAPTNGYLYISQPNTTNLYLNYDNLTTYSWYAGTNTWSAGTAWSSTPNPPPVNGGYFQLFFTNNAAYIATNNLVDSNGGYAFKLGSLVISNHTAGDTAGNRIVGSNLNFIVAGGGIDKLGAGNFQIDNNLVLSNSIVIGTSAGGTGTLTLMGAVSGNQAITKAGNFNLVLGGSNAAYSGTIFHNAGTLTFSNAMNYTLSNVTMTGAGAFEKAGSGALALDNSQLLLSGSGGTLTVNQGRLVLGGGTTGSVWRLTVAAGSEIVFTNGQNRLVTTDTGSGTLVGWQLSGALRFYGGTNSLYNTGSDTTGLRMLGGSTIEVVNAWAIWDGARGDNDSLNWILPQTGSTLFRVDGGVFSNAAGARSAAGADVTVVVTNGGKFYTANNWQFGTSKMTMQVAGSNSVFEVTGAGTAGSGFYLVQELLLNAQASDGGRIVANLGQPQYLTNALVSLTSGGTWYGKLPVGGTSNTLWVTGTNAVTGARSRIDYAGNPASWAGLSNLVFVADGGMVTNLTTLTVSGTQISLILTNGGQFYSGSTTLGSGSSNNTVVVAGNGALWNLGGQTLTIGSGAATGNWVRVGDGGTLRNGTVAFNVDGNNATNFGNYIQLDSNSTTAVNFAFGSVAGASFVTNRVESGSQSNLVRLGTATWDGGGANLTVGTGTGANSNLVYLGNVTLTNWGVWTVGAAASTGNTLRAGLGFTGTVASVVVTGVNNRLQFDAGVLTVTGMFTNNNGLAMQVGDGVQTGLLALTSASATSLFANGVLVASNATLRAVGTLTTAGATGVTLTNGATLAVGSTAAGGSNVGTLTVSALNWLAGGTYEWNITNFSGTAGVDWDLLKVTGALTNRDGTTATKYVLKIDTLDRDTNEVNFTLGTDYRLQIASFGSAAGYNPNLFAINTNSFVNAPTSGLWQVVRDSSGLYLTYFSLTADYTWTNTVSDAWGTATAWQPLGPPSPGNTLKLQFNGAGTDSYIATNDWGGTAFGALPGSYGIYTNNKLIFNSSSTGTNVLMGATLAFAGANASIYQLNSGMFIISNAVVLTTNMQFRGPGFGAVVLASNITGTAGSVQKLGLWELVLQGSNSFVGTVTLGDQYDASGGTLTLANAYALGANSVTVSNGTVIGTANFTTLGNGWSNQTVLVSGSGSVWTNGAALTIGSGAATGTVFTVANSGSLYVNGSLVVGTNRAAFNSLVITNGGRVFSTLASTIGAGGSNNSVLVTGTGSFWTNNNSLTIGSGAATGNVVTVANSGTLFVNNALVVGTNGAAGNSMVVTNGGVVRTTAASTIGSGGSNNSVLVTGSGSYWTNGAALTVGSGAATGNVLTVANSGSVAINGALTVGSGAGGNSVVVTNGAQLATTAASTIGLGGSNNTVTIAGGNAFWNLGSSNLTIGSGSATGNILQVGTGGLVTNLSMVIGVGAARSNTVTLAGGQLWATSLIATSAGNAVRFNDGTLATASTVYSNGADFVVGNGTSAATLILNGGTHLYQNSLVLTNNATLTTASGTTPTITVGGALIIGSNATLNIAGSGAVGTLTVTGTNLWAGGGNYLWNITSLAGPAGTAWDYIDAAGSVISNAATSANKFNINVNSMGGLVAGFDKDLTTNLLLAAGTAVNFNADAFAINTTDFSNAWDGVWSVVTNGAGATAGVYLQYEGARGFVWTNTTGQFSTWGQWLGNTNPPSYTTNVVLYFGGTNNQASYTADNDLSGLVAKRIVLTNQSANAQYIVGNSISLAGLAPEVLQNQDGSFIFSNGFVLATNTLFGGTGSGSLTMAGSLTGNGGLSLTGNYALVLSGSNSFRGITTITNGQIHVAHEYALGGSTVSNAALGQLVFTNLAAATFGGLAGTGEIGLTNADGAALALSLGHNNNNASYAGTLSSSGSVIKVGTGTQTLTGTNTYTGDTTVNNGTLTVSGQLDGSTNLIVTGGQFNWASLTAMTNLVAVTANGGTVNFSSSGTIGALTGNGGSINVNAGQTLQLGFGDVSTNFTGRLLGDGTLTKIGAGTWTVTNNNSAVANYVVSDGTNVQAGGTLAVTNLFVDAGASYLLNGGTLSAHTATNSSGALFAVGNGTNAATYQLLGGAHQIAGGMLVQSNALLTGAGTLAADVTLTNGASFAPGITVGSLTNAGTMVLTGGSRYLFDLSCPTNALGATNGWDYLYVTDNLTNAGTLTIDVRPSAVSYFDNDDTYALKIAEAGGTFQNNGTLAVTAGSFTNADGVWSASQSGSALWLHYEGSQIYYWTNTGAGVWNTSNWITNGIAATPAVATTNLVLAFTNGAAGGGFTAQNNFGADFVVKRLILSNANNSATNYLTGAPINLLGLNPRFQQEAGGMFVVSNNVNILSAGTLSFIGAGNGQLTMAGNIISTNTGAGGLLKGGGNYTLVLAGNNILSGTAAIANGTVVVAHQNALRGAVVSNTVANGLLFSNVTGATFAALAGNVNLGLTNTAGDGVGLVLSNGTASYAGILSGAGSLTKAGDNTQTLSGNSTYTGDTLVKRGTLTVQGQLANSTNLIVTGGQFNWNNVGAMSNVTAVSVTGGTVAFNGSGTIATLTGSGTVSVNGGSTLQVGYGQASGTTNTFGGSFATSGAGGTLSLIGENWFILNGGNSVLSNLVVNSGTFALNAGSLTANSLWATGGVFQVNGGTLRLGVLAGSGWISNGTDFVVGDGGSAATLNVVGGSLYVGNNVIVTNGGTLYGSGTLVASNGFGVVTIGSNAVIGAGASGTAVGTFTNVAANLVLAGGGSYLWHWTNATGTAGTGWDLVTVTGGVLSNAATTDNRFTIAVGSVASNFDLDATYTRLVATSTVSVVGSTNYAVDASAVAALADGLWSVTTNNGGVYVTYTGATNYIWNSTTGNWNSVGNWVGSPATPPPAWTSNLLVRMAGGDYVSTNDIDGIVLKRLVLTNETGNGVLVGSNLTFVGVRSLDQDGSHLFVISNNVVLGQATAFGGSGTGAVNLAGVISGTGGFTKGGSWSLLLNGSNTFVGNVGVTAGEVVFAQDAVFGAAGNTVTVQNATLTMTNNISSARAFMINNALLNVQGDSTVVLSGLSGTGLEKGNSGTLAVTGTGNMGGTTVIKDGTLRIGGGTWNAISNAAAGTLLFNPASSATINGNISGNGGLTMAGSGTLYLNGVNTNLTGGLTIQSGTVAANSDNALGNLSVAVAITNGTLRTTGNFSSTRALTTAVRATLDVVSATTNTWGGVISGSGGLTKSGAGMLILTSNNTYSGTTIVTGGTLRVDGTLSHGGGTVTVAGGATLAGTGTIARTVALTNGVIVAGNNAPGTLSVSNLYWQSGGTYRVYTTNFNVATPAAAWSQLSISNQLVFSGSGWVVDLISTNSYTGGDTNWVIARAGAPIVGFVDTNFTVNTAGFTGTADGTFEVGTNGNNLLLLFVQGHTWTSTVNSVWGNDDSWTGSAPPTNGMSTTLIFKGHGLAENTNTYFKAVKLIFDIGANSNQVLGGETVTMDGSTMPRWEMRGTNGAPVTISNNVNLAKTLAMTGSGNGTLTVAGNISGTNFTKTGSWSLYLSGANTFTGSVSIAGGVLGWNSDTALGAAANAVTLSNVVLEAGVGTILNPLTFTGANTITNTTGGGGTLTLLGAFDGAGSLTQRVSNLVLGSSGTYNGALVMPDGGRLIVSNATGNTLTISGVISGAGSITKVHGGTLALGGVNTYTGDTVVRSGTLLFSGNVAASTDGALGNNANAVILGGNDGAAALIGRDNATFSRAIALEGTGTRTIGAAADKRVVYSGTISGTGGLTVGGGGTVELTRQNNYGTTTVAGATLIVNSTDVFNTSERAVVVASSGTLGGTGVVAETTVAGSIAPGDLGVGHLTLSNSTWESGARYAWQLGSTTEYGEPVTRGEDWDFLTVSNLTLATGTYTVDIGAALFNPTDPSGTNSYQIGYAANGSWSKGALWAVNWLGANSNYDGYGWWVTTKNQNELWLNYSAGDNFNYAGMLVIPEPNVLLLWLSSIATVYAARRRMRGKPLGR